MKKILFYISFCLLLAVFVVDTLQMYTILVFHESRKFPYYYPYCKVMIPVSLLAIIIMFIYAVIKSIRKEGATRSINVRNMFIRGVVVTIIGFVPAFFLVGILENFVGGLF